MDDFRVCGLIGSARGAGILPFRFPILQCLFLPSIILFPHDRFLLGHLLTAIRVFTSLRIRTPISGIALVRSRRFLFLPPMSVLMRFYLVSFMSFLPFPVTDLGILSDGRPRLLPGVKQVFRRVPRPVPGERSSLLPFVLLPLLH